LTILFDEIFNEKVILTGLLQLANLLPQNEKTKKKSAMSDSLRKNAEELLEKRASVKMYDLAVPRSEADTLRLVAELEIYQIELEMQNDELHNAVEKSEKAVEHYDFAPIGLVTIGQYGSILELNLSAAQTLGKDRSVLIKRNFGLFVTTSTRDVYNNFFQKALASNVKQTCEVQLISQNNSIVFVLLTGIASDNGSKCLVTATDISERKQLEFDLILVKEKAERNESDLIKVQELTLVGSWYLDLATNEVTWSQELYKMYGFDPALPIPPYPEHQKHFTSESWETLSAAIAKTAESGTPYELELETVREDETNGWMWVSGETVTGKNKEIVGLWGAAQDITERKQLELDLVEEREKLEEFFSLSPSLMVITNPQGELFKINKSCKAILGYTEKQLQKLGLWNLVHPDDVDGTNDEIDRQLRGSRMLKFANRYRHKNGSYRTLEWQATLKTNGFTYAYANDVTERNEGVAALRKVREDQYKMLFDSMTEMVQIIALIYDKKGQPIDFYIREINESFATFLGKTKRQLIGKKASSIIGIIEESWLTAFAAVDKTGAASSFENYSAEFDRYFYVNAWKVDEDKVGLSFTDITEKKRGEQQKYESTLRLEKIQNDLKEAQKLAKIGSWLFDPSTEKLEWSEEMFNIWGFDSAKGNPDYDAINKRIHPNDIELYSTAVTRSINLGDACDIEYRICIPKSKEKVVRTVVKAVLGDTGAVVMLKGSDQDITSQKLFQDAQVKDRRLKAIGEMSSSIAHDFNNSLQEMMGNLEIVKLQSNLSESSAERLNNIGTIIGDVAGRVSALQKFGDTEHGDKNSSLLDFNALIAEVLSQSRPLWKDGVEKNGLRIDVKTDFEDVPKINCNSGELKSAIYNLIKNSVEAMPEGGDIAIKTGIKPEGVFAIFTDTGIGMDEEAKLKIFEPFYSTKGFELGRGLGMSGVYSIVKKYRGDIAIKASELGKGTSIEIVFPISQEDEGNVRLEDDPAAKASLRVLWVDDDLIITKSAGILVEAIGHKCNLVNSGKEALAHLNDNTCDVVFTDIGMPEMNGKELADAIRTKHGKAIKIVAVTGWELEEKVKVEYGIDFVLQKPFTLRGLKNIFEEL
jgi:PAS domain S-box-containing protein